MQSQLIGVWNAITKRGKRQREEVTQNMIHKKSDPTEYAENYKRKASQP